jgi:hypothetical protein
MCKKWPRGLWGAKYHLALIIWHAPTATRPHVVSSRLPMAFPAEKGAKVPSLAAAKPNVQEAARRYKTRCVPKQNETNGIRMDKRGSELRCLLAIA